jgi:CBS domain-containing protein
MAMHIKDVMTADPACCTPDTKLAEVAKMMVACDCGEIPVVDSDSERRPVGVVTDRDIVVRILASGINPLDKTAGDCMSTPPVTVRVDTRLNECCDLMESHQIRRIPVVDDDGRLIGIVAQADVALSAGSRSVGDVVKGVSQPGGQRH